LNSFSHRNSIDIIALQEVVYTDFEVLRGYTAHVNIGDSGRGTAIVVKQGVQVKDIERIPSGRAIAAEFQSHRMVNVYAPSGNNRRHERHSFFEEDIVYLLRDIPHNFILAGDFNGVLDNVDCTGGFQTCKALGTLLEKTNLLDTWKSQRRKPICTHITHHSASRIDRIYITKKLAPEITRTEVIVAPFTDHDAFAVHINLRSTRMDRGPSYWKLNIRVIYDECTKNDSAL
jgi:exonuclease III